MKVAILGDEIAPGSAPKLMGWPARKLKELGIDCEIVMMIDKGYRNQYKELFDFHLGDIKVRYLFPKFPRWVRQFNFKFPGMSFFSLHHVASWLWSYRGIRDNEFDLIIAHCQYTSLAARNILKHRHIPYVFLVWDPSTFTAKKIYENRMGWKFPLLYIFAKILDRLAVKGPKALITSGKYHHGAFRKLTDLPLEILAPGCFVLDQLPPFSSRKPMILTYDRWDIGNIPNVFVDILERINRNDVTLTIGGFWHPVSLMDDFKQRVRERGLEDRIKLLGPLDEKAIMDLCSEATVHIHPVHEAFGMQTLEAAACGCPGIIPAGSGVADLFEHGISGFHPIPGDVDAMVQYANALFNDPVLAEKMSRAAWQTARRYSWDHHAKRLKAISDRYAGEKSGRTGNRGHAPAPKAGVSTDFNAIGCHK